MQWSFQKFNRRAQDWAIVGASIVCGDGHAGVGLVNMHSVPFRSEAVESALLNGANAEEAGELAAEGTEAPSDLNASKDYREHLARVLVRRGLQEAGSRRFGLPIRICLHQVLEGAFHFRPRAQFCMQNLIQLSSQGHILEMV